MPTLLEPTTANFRAEKARYRLTNSEVADEAGMPHDSTVAMYLNDYRPLRSTARRDLARAFNRLIGAEAFAEYLSVGEDSTGGRGVEGEKESTARHGQACVALT